MRNDYFRKVIVGFLVAILALAFCGCGAFGSNDDSKPVDPAVYISQSEISLAVGDSVKLNAVSTDGSEVTWDTSNAAVATVVDGLVTGVAEGQAIIMASTDSVMTVCTINVKAAGTSQNPSNPGGTQKPETLVLSISSYSLGIGDKVTLIATSSDSNAQIIWDSSNKTVATVNNGTVTALAEGKTTITANTGTAVASCEIRVTQNVPSGAQKPGYSLVWNDEFNGTALDRTKWNYQEGIRDIYHEYDSQNWNWGNNEQQYYTQDSVKVENGSLVITAKRQETEGKPYKSGRILTRDLASWTYGYFEAKMKTPTGNGMWPAFWMLPQPSSYANVENKYGGWPYNGEIDIMEAKGSRLNKIDTTLHFGPITVDSWSSQYTTKETTLSSNTDEWHTYAVEWTADYIAWIVDGKEEMRMDSSAWYTRSPAATSDSAPFDQPFYILLNLAVGGMYDGGVEPDASFTQASMYVDYVRVYEKN